MKQEELAVRLAPGALPRRGTVLQRGKTASASVLILWDDGDQERVKATDRSVGYAREGSRHLAWLLEPGLIDEDFNADPLGVFTEVIKEAGKITVTMLVRSLTQLGLDDRDIRDAYAKTKDALKIHPHIEVKGASHRWSDAPIVRVDPYDHLRKLSPHEALDQLATGKNLRAPQKAALADAVRSALPPLD